MPKQFICKFVTDNGTVKFICRMTKPSAPEVKAELPNFADNVCGAWEVAEV
jgi:hypothetical protein